VSRLLNIELLRNRLGFNGLIVSDATSMAGIGAWASRRDFIAEIVSSGCDVILFAPDFEQDAIWLREALDDGRLTIGKNTLLEPGCWITIADEGRVRIGEGCFLNLHTMIASQNEVTIGDNTMFANHCFVSDASHKYDNPSIPVTWQGFDSKGPTRIGSNCWFGIGCVVTTGVTIGDRCVVGANSVVTRDLPEGVIAAGAPAKVIRPIDFGAGEDTTRLATS
jgi:acetyltransferase-like isoleucine patch superfamily enzyme